MKTLNRNDRKVAVEVPLEVNLFFCALADLFDHCVPCRDRHVLGCNANLKVVQLLKTHLETPFYLILLPSTSPQNMKMET